MKVPIERLVSVGIGLLARLAVTGMLAFSVAMSDRASIGQEGSIRPHESQATPEDAKQKAQKQHADLPALIEAPLLTFKGPSRSFKASHSVQSGSDSHREAWIKQSEFGKH